MLRLAFHKVQQVFLPPLGIGVSQITDKSSRLVLPTPVTMKPLHLISIPRNALDSVSFIIQLWSKQSREGIELPWPLLH